MVRGKRRLFVLDYYDPMTSLRLTLSTILLTLVTGLPVARAEVPPVNSDLNSSMMYALLVAEISAQNGDAASAYQIMLDSAQKARSNQLFERAVEIALRARAGESALQAAQTWSRALPESKEAARYVIQILVGLNKLTETVEPIRRSIANALPQDRAVTIASLPRYFVRVEDKKLAAKVVELALTQELTSATTGPAAHATIGTLRLLAGDAEGSLEAARKGAALNARSEEPAQLALALMDPKLPGAEALVVQHIQAGARPELHMAYVHKLIDFQRYQEASEQTILINTRSPEFSDAWLIRGSLAHREKNNREAVSALTQLVQLKQAADAMRGDAVQDRSLSQAYYLLGDIAEQNKQWLEAERNYRLVENPQDALRALSRRGVVMARLGKLEEGRALIRSAPELQPEDARLKISAETQLLREFKQFQSVYEVLQQAVKGKPEDADYLYDLAMAAEKLDRLDEMESLLRKVIALKPDYHHAYNALGYSLADRKLRLGEARNLIRKALEYAPEDPFILDSLAWVEYRSGNLEQALQILQGAYKSRQDPEIAAHLGEVLWAMSQPKEALAIWRDGLTQSPENDTLNETVKRLSRP